MVFDGGWLQLLPSTEALLDGTAAGPKIRFRLFAVEESVDELANTIVCDTLRMGGGGGMLGEESVDMDGGGGMLLFSSFFFWNVAGGPIGANAVF